MLFHVWDGKRCSVTGGMTAGEIMRKSATQSERPQWQGLASRRKNRNVLARIIHENS